MKNPTSKLRVLVAFVVLGVGLAGLGVARLVFVPGSGVLEGVRVAGRGIDVSLGDAVAEASTRIGACDVEFVDEGRVLDKASLESLGVRIDADRTVADIEAIGRDASWIRRAYFAKDAAAGAFDVPLRATVDAEPLIERLAPIKLRRDQPPVAARVDFESGGVKHGRAGKVIDVDATYQALLERVEALARGDGLWEKGACGIRLPVAFASPSPYVSEDYVRTVDRRVKLAEYVTYFSRTGEKKHRGRNIDVAGEKLSGLVLPPHQIISFNRLVGPRSETNGFEKSWEIYKGEMVEGIGGGTCQVASTMHAASFFSGLDIVERAPHSRPSAYIPMGLDATVAYPIVDMKVRNPFDFPIAFQVTTAASTITFTIWGREKPYRVKFTRDLVEAEPFHRKVVEEEDTPRGRVVLKQHGIRGYKFKRTRTLIARTGKRIEESTDETYPATYEIYEVPEGFDASQLPPIAEGGVMDEPAASEDTPPATAPGADQRVARADPPCEGEGCVPSGPGYEVIEGRGAHKPDDAAKNPDDKFTIFR